MHEGVREYITVHIKIKKIGEYKMTKEKRDKRIPILMTKTEYDDLQKRVEATSFKNKSDYLRASIYLPDLVRQTLKIHNIDFCKDSDLYNKIDDFREQKNLEKIRRRKSKKHVVVPQVDPKILNQVVRAGNNLNQVAYSLNKAVIYNDKIDAYEILTKLLEIENQNKEIIELMKVSRYQNPIKEEYTYIEEDNNNEGGERDDSRIY